MFPSWLCREAWQTVLGPCLAQRMLLFKMGCSLVNGLQTLDKFRKRFALLQSKRTSLIKSWRISLRERLLLIGCIDRTHRRCHNIVPTSLPSNPRKIIVSTPNRCVPVFKLHRMQRRGLISWRWSGSTLLVPLQPLLSTVILRVISMDSCQHQLHLLAKLRPVIFQTIRRILGRFFSVRPLLWGLTRNRFRQVHQARND